MPIPVLHGNSQGLKPSQLKALERLYKRRVPKGAIYSHDQARELAYLSRALNRQIALLIDRAGKPQYTILGTASTILIPELPPLSRGRLRGLYLLHTHLSQDGLNDEDLLDMLFLRLDGIYALTTLANGEPDRWQGAWLYPEHAPDILLAQPGAINRHGCYLGALLPWHQQECKPVEIARELERSLLDKTHGLAKENRAILVSVSSSPKLVQEQNLDELAALCHTAGIMPSGRVIQRIRPQESQFLPGKGKLAELEVAALGANADMLVFDGELAPAQLRAIADLTERRVLDRTQVILDIFAQNANSKAGKLQVELAQLAYAQPRLAGARKALDRLAGGIGGRGPGETRLETDRRRLKSRIAFLKTELEKIRQQRALARSQRERAQIPLVALVGYTNAGKSTLLNRLTASTTLAANRLFATLDPVTRRLRFPKEREITLADTVGFIRNLPRELSDAFAATLEELERADLLIHVADAGQPEPEKQIAAVEAILLDLGLSDKPRLLALNKCDKPGACELPGAIRLSAATGEGLEQLLVKIEQMLFMEGKTTFRSSRDGRQ